MEINIDNLDPEDIKELKRKLKEKGAYKKKGIYREKEIKTRFFNPDEWESYIYSLGTNLQFYNWFLMLTGLRYKEAKHVRVHHIDFKNKQLIVIKPKGGKVMRYVQLSSYAIKLIRTRITEKNLKYEDTFNFPSIQHISESMKLLCKKKNIPNNRDFSTHNLRKTHENYLMALSFPENKMTMHMGHTQKTAQEHYLSSAFIKDKKQLDKIRTWLGDIFGDLNG